MKNHKGINEFIKELSKRQSFKRKLRNKYLGLKYRFEDFIQKIRSYRFNGKTS